MLISQGLGNPRRLQIDLGKWHEGASKQEKIPSPNDILFYPCSHRVNPPRLSSLNEINEAASRKNRGLWMVSFREVWMCYSKIEGARWPGGRVAEWTACQNRKPAVLGLSPALNTCWICFLVVPNSLLCPINFVNSQLACQSNYILFELSLFYYLITGLTALPPWTGYLF